MRWFRRKSDGEPTAAGADAGSSGSEAGLRRGEALAQPAASGTVTPEQPAVTTGVNPEQLRAEIIEVLRTVYDPEIPVNVYEIGLVYEIGIEPAGKVRIRMTLTSPMCPVAESLPIEVENKVAGIRGVTDVSLDLVWEPPWTPAMMSEEARLLLNIG
jgi:FeS assembly SUF system protein